VKKKKGRRKEKLELIEACVWVYEDIDLKKERFTLQEIKKKIMLSEILWTILDTIYFDFVLT
jgi:hypothetical protein